LLPKRNKPNQPPPPPPVQAEAKSANVRNNWISGEIGTLGFNIKELWFAGLGFRYERMLNSKISLGLRFNYGSRYTNLSEWRENGKIYDNGLSIEGAFRWYPFGKTFFMGTGLGYHWIIGGFFTRTEWSSAQNHFFNVYENYYLHAIGSTFEFGWKLDIGKAGGFFMEIFPQGSIAFGKNPITETSEIGGHIGLYLGMGVAFK
jgi:hypothetical protein